MFRGIDYLSGECRQRMKLKLMILSQHRTIVMLVLYLVHQKDQIGTKLGRQ